MAREVRARVSLSIAAILENDYRRGQRVGIQERIGIANASGNAQEHIRRKGMRIVNLAGSFLLLGILALPGLLLHEFVWHFVANGVLPEGQENAVAIGKIAFVRG